MALIPWEDCELTRGSLAFTEYLVCLANDDINLGAKGIMHYSTCNQLLNLNSGRTINFFSRRVINSQGPEPSNLYLHEQSSLIEVISLGNCLGEQGPCNTEFEESASEGTTSVINRLKKYTCTKVCLGDLQIYMLSAS